MDSPCTFQSRLLYWRLLLAVFAALGTMYAMASIKAELAYARAWKNLDRPIELRHADVQEAMRWFPLDYRMRLAEAEFYSLTRWKGSRPHAIAAIRRAIATNPYAFDLRRNLAGFLWEAGDKDEALRELTAIKRFVPLADISIMVNVNPDTN